MKSLFLPTQQASTRGKIATENLSWKMFFRHSNDVTDVADRSLHHEYLDAMEVCSLQDLDMWDSILLGNFPWRHLM